MKDLSCFTIDSATRKPTGSGTLSGLTFAAKDLVSIKGHVSSFGHARWRATHKAADTDSSIITTLLSEGAELFGTTKMEQLAYSIIGNLGEGEAPINTKYPGRLCGGSSSGSASAVAGGLVDFAIGSDTGGSIRIPAAACGIYGIRTTFGLIPVDGTIELAKSADVLGFLARTPEMLLKVTSLFAPSTDKKTQFRRLLLPKNLENYTDIDVGEFEQAARELAAKHDLDIGVVDISEFISPDTKDLFVRLQSREIWEAHGEWAGQNMSYLAEEVQQRLFNCQKLAADSESTKRRDAELSAKYRDGLEAFVGKDAALCLPILPTNGPKRGLSDEESLSFRGRAFMNMVPSSISGLPELSAPITNGTSNMGILGPRFSDLQLIGLFC